MTTKIFIVDDHYMIIEGIRSLVCQNEKGFGVDGTCMNATSCMHSANHKPNIILLDITYDLAA